MSRIWARALSMMFGLGLMASNAVLFAAEGKDEMAEPVWVMSWATFIFLVALTIYLFSHSLKRAESLLNAEDRKQIEDEMVQRIAAKKKKARHDAIAVAQRKK